MKNRPKNPKEGTPQVENGYVEIANELWEALMYSDFTKRERKVIDVIIRFSYGCNKKFALLQKTDIAYFAAIDLSDACKTTTSLIKRKVVKHNPPNIFYLNKHYREWEGLNTPTESYFQKVGDVVGKNLLGETPSEVGKTTSKPLGKIPSTGQNTQSEVGKTPSSTGRNTQLPPTQPPETIEENPSVKTIKDIIKDSNNKRNTPEVFFADYRQRYSPSDLEIIDKAIDAFASTRKSYSVSERIILNQYKRWERYEPWQVIQGLKIYLDRDYASQGKAEDYALGIIRRQSEKIEETEHGEDQFDPTKIEDWEDFSEAEQEWIRQGAPPDVFRPWFKRKQTT